MITVTIAEAKNHVEIVARGHSMGTDEPCARVSTTLDLIKVFLTRFTLDSERLGGYTFLKLIKSPLSEEALTNSIIYLKELSKLYPNHITITERKI